MNVPKDIGDELKRIAKKFRRLLQILFFELVMLVILLLLYWLRNR